MLGPVFGGWVERMLRSSGISGGERRAGGCGGGRGVRAWRWD